MSEKDDKLNKGSFLYIGDQDKAQWGYPEGYPYKEVTVTDALTWNGVSDIVVGSGGGSNVQFGFVSAIMPTQEDLIKGGSIVMSNGYEVTFDASAVFSFAGLLLVSAEDSPFIIVALEDNCTLNDSIVFPKAGIYFIGMDSMYIASFSINGYWFKTETIHLISPDFLPQATQATYGAIKKAAHVPHVTAAPTNNDFNKLLSALREAGIMSQSK